LADALVVQKQGTGFHVHRSPRTTSTVEPYSQLPFRLTVQLFVFHIIPYATPAYPPTPQSAEREITDSNHTIKSHYRICRLGLRPDGISISIGSVGIIIAIIALLGSCLIPNSQFPRTRPHTSFVVARLSFPCDSHQFDSRIIEGQIG
jgi:hypothetical protein